MAVAEALKHLKKATTDNEKIATLLLVSKVVRAGEVSEEERRQIFDAIGFSFVNRLLNTTDEATSDGSVVVSAYQRLAVTLLACFTTDPQLATHVEVTSKIPLFLEFISIKCPQSDLETMAMKEDCLQILLSLTCSPAGLHLLLSSGCMLVAARLLVAGSACRSSVRKLVEAMVGQSAVVSRHSEIVGEVVSILATEFRANQGELKFELCDVLYSVLSAAGEQVMAKREVPWLRDVAAGLHDILSSKISSAMRASALLLSAQLCQSCGVEWTLTSGDNKLFRLLANLAAIEVQLCVEGLQLEAVTLPQSQLLCGCCAILETSLVFTATQTQIASNKRVLTEEDMLQLHSAFSEAFKSITEFLNSLSPCLPPHSPLILATVRVLGAWLAEESLALTYELYQLLPRLLEMCRAHLQDKHTEDNVADNNTAEERCLENPLKFLLPGLSHLVAEDTPRSIVKTVLPQLLLEYMTALYGRENIHKMSPEAVSSFTLSVEVLLTVCVCEKGLRKGEVFAEIARLLSRLLVSGCPDIRLALQAGLLWLMIAHEQGQQCCEVMWNDLWHRIAEILLTALKLIIPPDHTQANTSRTSSADIWEPLAELWHLTMREVTSFAVSTPDVRQLLLDSNSLSDLIHSTATYAGEHKQEVAAIRRLMEVLH